MDCTGKKRCGRDRARQRTISWRCASGGWWQWLALWIAVSFVSLHISSGSSLGLVCAAPDATETISAEIVDSADDHHDDEESFESSPETPDMPDDTTPTKISAAEAAVPVPVDQNRRAQAVEVKGKSFSEILRNSGQAAVSGGLPGFVAGIIQV